MADLAKGTSLKDDAALGKFVRDRLIELSGSIIRDSKFKGQTADVALPFTLHLNGGGASAKPVEVCCICIRDPFGGIHCRGVGSDKCC